MSPTLSFNQHCSDRRGPERHQRPRLACEHAFDVHSIGIRARARQRCKPNGRWRPFRRASPTSARAVRQVARLHWLCSVRRRVAIHPAVFGSTMLAGGAETSSSWPRAKKRNAVARQHTADITSSEQTTLVRRAGCADPENCRKNLKVACWPRSYHGTEGGLMFSLHSGVPDAALVSRKLTSRASRGKCTFAPWRLRARLGRFSTGVQLACHLKTVQTTATSCLMSLVPASSASTVLALSLRSKPPGARSSRTCCISRRNSGLQSSPVTHSFKFTTENCKATRARHQRLFLRTRRPIPRCGHLRVLMKHRMTTTYRECLIRCRSFVRFQKHKVNQE